ncbi:hypothetical protein ACOMHN_024000 [Nucella lapillus]
MYDTSPHSPLKGDPRQLWPEDITKDLESLFDLDPALEETLDFSELCINLGGAALPAIPDSSGIPTTVTSAPVDLLTLTTEPLASLPVFTAAHVLAATSPVSFQAPAASPGVVPEVAVPADVLMPEYHSLVAMATTPSTTTNPNPTTSQEEWGASTFSFSTVKTEDLSLSSLTACSLEASLPGFTASATLCKSEPMTMMQEDSCSQFSYSPRSTRSLSESSTATSCVPDSPRRSSKGGTKRRQVPKGSEEYKEKRARNNVAVRKSRAKAKQKQKVTEGRVKELLDMNESLHKRLEMLTKEVTVLKGLFMNVGASLPEEYSKLMETS